ncbi:xanthine dehydrogenase family protein molybdopterin-binding subunit [Amycolatopsis sp. cmx-4-83]|uniref:xanthine dehydrogenase family protein molybdopterin-binding subunit n=1 Tax=Amycolatopsis sp. cmx-4-83 TaxID=2790940 RepID=UPI00397A5810
MIGVPVPRREDARLLAGRGRFVADIRPEGTVHAAFVRSTHAHARIRSVAVDVPAIAVVTAADFPGGPPLLPGVAGSPPPARAAQPVLADGRVRYVGEPIAIVVAADRYAAEDVAALVSVEYEPLGAEVPLHEGGDVEQVIRARTGAAPPASFEASFTIARQAAAPVEPRGVVAEWDDARGLTLWTSTQIPHLVRDVVARFLGLATDRVRVVLPDVGGAFGAKMQPYPEELLVAWLARRLRRPVTWLEDRDEHETATTHGRDQRHDVEVTHDEDGRVLAIRDRITTDIGAYAFTNAVADAVGAAGAVPGPYRIPAYEVESRAVFSAKTPSSPFRGVGAAPATFVAERIMDLVAARTGLDPVTVRLRNLLTPDELPFDRSLVLHTAFGAIPWPVLDSGDYPAALRKALELARYDDFRREQRRERERDRHLGIGFGCYVEGTGGGAPETATARVVERGRVEVTTGTAPSGQGHETVLAQIAADELGIPVDDVVVVLGDTARIPRGGGTMASRSAVLGGGAVRLAARKLRRGTESSAEATFDPAGSPAAYGVHVSTVEVDTATGLVTPLRHLVVHDCGTVLNPALLAGQIHGGLGFAIGDALIEEVAYRPGGRPLEYRVPGPGSMPPEVEIHHTDVSFPAPGQPDGVKGAGEGAVIGGTAAVANAVADAVGVPVTTIPLTPERVLRLVRDSLLEVE